MDVYVKTQAELDAIPLDTKDEIYVGFGTKEKPAIVRGQYWHIVKAINNSVVATYSNSEVCARDNSIVFACDNSEVIADYNSNIYAYDNSKVWAFDNSKIYAYDNSKISAYNNSQVSAYVNSKVFACDNSKACACGNSIVYAHHNSIVAAYDNSEVVAFNDKNIVSISDNAIVSNPSILCSGAELLNQCNGNVGNIKFTVSNVSDENKDSAFDKFYTINGRVFVLTMRGVPYYCVYNFNTMSVKFCTMDFYRAFKNIADDTVFAYYLDNVLMPALVNTKFDKSRMSNII